jgi:hypothetical protein
VERRVGHRKLILDSTSKSRPVCTAGIPVENSSGKDGLIEAGHCFTPNNGVYTQNFGPYS